MTISTARKIGIDINWAISRRVSFLNQKISELKSLKRRFELFLDSSNALERHIAKADIKDINNQIKKLIINIKYTYKSNTTGITSEKIKLVKKVNMRKLVKVIKDRAVCPFHKDIRPSAVIEENRLYCYVCNKGFDTIDVVQKTNKLSFYNAIRYLLNE